MQGSRAEGRGQRWAQSQVSRLRRVTCAPALSLIQLCRCIMNGCGTFSDGFQAQALAFASAKEGPSAPHSTGIACFSNAVLSLLCMAHA